MKEQQEKYSLPEGWLWGSLSDVVLNPKADLVDGPFFLRSLIASRVLFGKFSCGRKAIFGFPNS